MNLFRTLRVYDGTVQWIHGQDISPEWLSDDGEILINNTK